MDLIELAGVARTRHEVICDCCLDSVWSYTMTTLLHKLESYGWEITADGARCADCISPENEEGPDYAVCQVCGGEVADSEGDEWGGEPVHFSCARDNGIPTYLDPNPTMKLEV